MMSEEQEAHVAEIIRGLTRYHAGGQGVAVGHGSTNRVLGASGFRHQIDVTVALGKDLVLYECKRWGKNVDVEAVLTFVGRVIDIREADPGVQVNPYIVVNEDLTKGAKKLAKHFGIEQLVWKSPAEFGLSLWSSHRAGVSDAIGLSDHPSA